MPRPSSDALADRDARAIEIRPRRPSDLPGLAALLGTQQATSRYPLRWPLPFPVEQFLVRSTEERAAGSGPPGCPTTSPTSC